MIKALTKTQRARLLRLTKPMMLEEIMKLVDMLRETPSRDEVEKLREEKARDADSLRASRAACEELRARLKQTEEENRELYKQTNELSAALRREKAIVNKLVGT